MSARIPKSWSAKNDDAEWWIVGAGASTSIGRSYLGSMAAARAGICRYTSHPYLLDDALEPVVTAHASQLAVDLVGEARVSALAARALDDIVASLPQITAAGRIRAAAWLCLPADDAFETDLGANLEPQVRMRLGDSVQVVAATSQLGGHSTAFEVLAETIQSTQAELVFLLGADSYVDARRVRQLEHSQLLRTAARPWGMTPGEAAGVVALARPRLARRHGFPVLGRLIAAAAADEPHPHGSGRVCIGEGLSLVFDHATRSLHQSKHRVDETYCDLNGNAARVDELGFTMSRFASRFVQPGSFTAPAACWGDVGTASGPLLLQLACFAWQRGWAGGEFALAWTSSGGVSGRAAALLRKA